MILSGAVVLSLFCGCDTIEVDCKLPVVFPRVFFWRNVFGLIVKVWLLIGRLFEVSIVNYRRSSTRPLGCVVHPGVILKGLMRVWGIGVAELSEASGICSDRIELLLAEKIYVDDEMKPGLSRVFHVPEPAWDFVGEAAA